MGNRRLLAVDTNVVVRDLTEDRPSDSTRARKLFDNQNVFVATSVLLETECSAQRLRVQIPRAG